MNRLQGRKKTLIYQKTPVPSFFTIVHALFFISKHDLYDFNLMRNISDHIVTMKLLKFQDKKQLFKISKPAGI